MSVIKWYEVCCDICGAAINHYLHYKPSIKQLREDCGKVVISHGKLVVICKNCNKMDENTLKQRIIEIVADDMLINKEITD